MTDETVAVTIAEANALGRAALEAIGLTVEEARIVVDHLIDNSLCGYRFAGLPRILAIADSADIRRPRFPMTVEHETAVSARIDGGNHVGYVVMHRCVGIAIEKARASGVALIGAHNSYFSGRNAYYLERIAREGFVAIHTVGATPFVVPPGASKRFLGTNPLAIALPGDPDPLMFDIGTAAMMTGEVLLKSYLGEDLPDGVGVDADGVSTNVAADVVKGGVLPFAGHKGFGLSLMIQALGLLGGAAAPGGGGIDRGFLFIVFDPALLLPRERFKEELGTMISRIKALPKQPGVDDIRIPSERGYREREERRAAGVISIDRPVYDRLVHMGRQHH